MSSQEFENELQGVGKEEDLIGPDPIEYILEKLSGEERSAPFAALAAADACREELTPRLLEALEQGNRQPVNSSAEGATLFCHALYLLAKWRETRALPAVCRWLSLPGENASEIAGDVAPQDGGIILASVCGGDLAAIQTVLENEAADEMCRAQAMVALAALVVWEEARGEDVCAYLVEFAATRLEGQVSVLWLELAMIAADFQWADLVPLVRNAFDKGWIDPIFGGRAEFEEEMKKKGVPPTELKLYSRITDVAEATAWWGCYHQPIARVAKVGRNERCPCGSGKKYKKCCGKGG